VLNGNASWVLAVGGWGQLRQDLVDVVLLDVEHLAENRHEQVAKLADAI